MSFSEDYSYGGANIELYCKLDNIQALVDALNSIKWKRQQDAHVEISALGLAITVEELTCLQGRIYFRSELFREYHYQAEVRPRFGVSLSTLVDCLNIFTSTTTNHTALEIRYPGPDMELMLRLMEENQTCTDAEIRTRLVDLIPRDFAMEDSEAGSLVSFALKSAALKEAIEDLEWPGSSVELTVTPQPPAVMFRAEGHGDLQIDFLYNMHTDLFVTFNCDRRVSFTYKYKFLKATTAHIPTGLLRDNMGTKMTIDARGLLKVQHLITVRSRLTQTQQHPDSMGPSAYAGSRNSYIEFYVVPEDTSIHHMAEEYEQTGTRG